MSNHTTGAQRYNNRMDKIWETARRNGAFKTRGCKINKTTAKVIGQVLRNSTSLNGVEIMEFSRIMEESCDVKRSDF